MKMVSWIYIINILALCYGNALAIKIGISKTQSTIPTTIISDTVTTAEAISENTLLSDTTLKTTVTTPITTNVPNIFKFPAFPPKKPLPSVSTTMPTIATTASTTLESNSTDALSLPNNTAYAVQNKYYFCNCDLVSNTCDINCCCDPDCTYDALKIFKCLAEPAEQTDLKRRLEDFQYQHGLPSCKLNDGWLCVFRTNIHSKDEDKTLTQAHYDTTHTFKWTNPRLDNSAESTEYLRDYYQIEQKLYRMNLANMQIEDFALPLAYIPPHCHLSEPIRYLKTFKSSCLITNLEQLQEHSKRLSDIITQTKLLSSPKQFSSENINFDEVDLLEIKLHICKNIDKGTPICDLMPAANWNNYYTYMDINNTYIERAVFKIVHNFTNPLAVILQVNELELPDADEIVVWQHYEVQFYYQNHTALNDADLIHLNTTKRRNSGPLGYLKGEPIIVTKLVPQDDTHNGQVLSYFHEDSITAMHSPHTLQVFNKQRGNCVLSNTLPPSYIKYGINMYKQCKVRLEHQQRINSTHFNYTALCLQLQQLINKQLLGYADGDMKFEEMSQLFISVLGKPENNTEQWIQLQLQKSYIEYQPIVGELHTQTSRFTCRNMLIAAAYDFHIGEFMVHSIRHQSVVKRAVLDMGKYHDLEFELNEQIQVPISLAVMFYDLNNIIATSNARIFHNIYVIIYFKISAILLLVI